MVPRKPYAEEIKLFEEDFDADLLRQHMITIITKSVYELDLEGRYGPESSGSLMRVRENMIFFLTNAINEMNLKDRCLENGFKDLMTLRQDLTGAISKAINHVEQLRMIKLKKKQQCDGVAIGNKKSKMKLVTKVFLGKRSSRCCLLKEDQGAGERPSSACCDSPPRKRRRKPARRSRGSSQCGRRGSEVSVAGQPEQRQLEQLERLEQRWEQQCEQQQRQHRAMARQHVLQQRWLDLHRPKRRPDNLICNGPSRPATLSGASRVSQRSATCPPSTPVSTYRSERSFGAASSGSALAAPATPFAAAAPSASRPATAASTRSTLTAISSFSSSPSRSLFGSDPPSTLDVGRAGHSCRPRLSASNAFDRARAAASHAAHAAASATAWRFAAGTNASSLSRTSFGAAAHGAVARATASRAHVAANEYLSIALENA